MSSVLKALRQQQSDLIPQQQPVQLAPLPPRSRRHPWVWLVLALVAALALGWFASSVFLLRTTVPPGTAAEGQTLPIRLGEPAPVRQVSLPVAQTTEDTQPTAEAQPTESTFASPPALDAGQGVDLNQVPAELLAAFEEAIAATGNGAAGDRQQSVLPRIEQLPPEVRRQIPGFTYDAHQYSSRVPERFVELAGQRLRQGDFWKGIQVLTIAPNHVVLVLGQQAFQQPALEDWTSSP
ncbi:general secretion pathway protein GspB [Pseudidiomarina insulisalsae]|uniref:Type II secretion system protein GspB C-terminal domain-containing protein n=1 Tax=Pseudidiomarina insulisalsae TaxID=575789 RepID=A0A432YHS9_9GAMM|nr:general secretion pathway protein GspB [Pseudidiomarina insulisalsae]RUO60503.1 hypothetical protein CWI71_06440 [Pseudidiomarina insulisalsae]